jgi:carboxybiotin decarboxylase
MFVQTLHEVWLATGIASMDIGSLFMIAISGVLIYLGIHKEFEPLLLIPIGFGGILANVPVARIAAGTREIIDPLTLELTTEFGGFLGQIYGVGIASGLFPVLIFVGIGSLTDFGPLIANPKTAFLGAAAQFGIFSTVIGTALLTEFFGFGFSLADAGAIGIIGGADGPTAIFIASRLSPRLLGAVAVAAYTYMALVPIIQPPIVKLLTTKAERSIRMKQLRQVSRLERILFPLVALALCVLLLPTAAPLIGALMFGNLLRESGVTERLARAAGNEMINIVTILLGLAVGSKLGADEFLQPETLGIILLGLAAFAIGTASGVLLAKLLNKLPGNKINPLLGAAGVSAVPMAARVAARMGREEDHGNYLLMHAMGPNVAGVLGSAVAAGVLLAIIPILG